MAFWPKRYNGALSGGLEARKSSFICKFMVGKGNGARGEGRKLAFVPETKTWVPTVGTRRVLFPALPA